MRELAMILTVCLVALSTARAAGAGERPTTRVRDEISDEVKWDLSHIYESWEAWEADLERLKEMGEKYQELKGTLGEGPERILAASKLSDELGQLLYRVYQYPGLLQYQDSRDNDVKARLGRVQIAMAQFQQDTAWYTPELLTIPEETMEKWLDETPELAPYRFGIEESYRQQKHVLDEAGEELLALASKFNSTPNDIYQMMSSADIEFPTVTLSSGKDLVASPAGYRNALRSERNQADREAVFKAHAGVFDQNANSYAAVYNASLQRDWFMAQARSYGSTLEAALDGDNIPVAVVENLIAGALNGAEPLQRYHRIRKQILGLEKYTYYDAYLPIVEIDWPFPYDQAQPLIVEALAPFGPEYQAGVQKAFGDRWIDVYENEGKQSGAFSAGVYGVHPYILLNYADTLNDAFTVAHELGHSLHTMMAHENQPFATADYSGFVAEVASMTNENFLLESLLATEKDPKRRAVILQRAIDDIAGGFYRQVMFADFELRAHRAVEEGQPITAAALQELYLATLADYFGDSLDDQELYENTWARIHHFYGYVYYVFKYATSKSAASLLHREMSTGTKEEQAAVVTRYLDLLKAGGSDHPVELLKRAGVDFTTPAPFEAMVATMDRLVTQLEVELKELGLPSDEN